MKLDFEKPILDLESKLAELRHLSSDEMDIASEVKKLETKVQKLLEKTYTTLTPWQKVQVARQGQRPHTSHYIERLIEDFVPLAGDRTFGEDAAIIGGMGRFRGMPVMIMGHEKGHDTDTRVKHNFGMARPEGYRKAIRLMELADQFNLPIITLVDTAGAHPAIEAEERGQSVAIAKSMEACCNVEVPLVATIIGEGGSGGAIAIAVGNRVMMLEHAVYSVISPEGCASILWRTKDKRDEAAAAQKLTAQDLEKLGVIDRIISEPLGGAHRSPLAMIDAYGDALEKELKELLKKDGLALKKDRREKFINMGRTGIVG